MTTCGLRAGGKAQREQGEGEVRTHALSITPACWIRRAPSAVGLLAPLIQDCSGAVLTGAQVPFELLWDSINSRRSRLVEWGQRVEQMPGRHRCYGRFLLQLLRPAIDVGAGDGLWWTIKSWSAGGASRLLTSSTSSAPLVLSRSVLERSERSAPCLPALHECVPPQLVLPLEL